MASERSTAASKRRWRELFIDVPPWKMPRAPNMVVLKALLALV